MNALIDTSVLLRVMLGEPEPLAEWPAIRRAFASRVLLVELGRVIDRLRLDGSIGDADVEQLHEQSRRLIASIDVVGLTDAILMRAAASMPTVLGSLGAIHLATAIELGDDLGVPIVLATHDAQLARAARASGLEVVGS